MDSWSCGDELPPDAAGMRERARMSAFMRTDTRATGFLENFDCGSGWRLHGFLPCLVECVPNRRRTQSQIFGGAPACRNLRHPEPGGDRVSPVKNGGGQNARATGGPGILPETKEVHWFSRTTHEDTPKFRERLRMSQPPGIVLEMRTNPRPYCEPLRWNSQLIEHENDGHDRDRIIARDGRGAGRRGQAG
jgi:hypothetical protein